MRSIAVLACLVATLPVSALAADLPVTVPAAVPAAPVFNWSGLYGGLHVGGRWAEHNDIMFLAPTGTTFTGTTSSSVVGGVHAGYNFQLTPNLLIGIEGDVSYGRNEASLTGVGPSIVTTSNLPNTPLPGENILTTTTRTISQRMASELDWQGSLRGRIGFTHDRLLVYATGGLALGNIEVDVTQTSSTTVLVQRFRTLTNTLLQSATGTQDGPTLTASRSQIRAGWTIGAGAEYAIDQNWFLRGEYLYADYGRVSVSLADGSSASARIETHTARIGLSYRLPPQ